MQIDLNTLLSILISNGQEFLITKCIEVQLSEKIETPEAITVGVSNRMMEKLGYKINPGQNTYAKCKVLKVDHFRTNHQYQVELPDGSKTWASDSSEAPTILEKIEQ